MIGAVVLFGFLYFIKLILLPFVLAAIVAYICTPLWIGPRRTRWPRLVFAIAAFLVLFGISGVVLLLAARNLLVELRAIARELQGMIENFTRQAIGDGPVSLFGSSVNAHDIAQSALERLRDWAGQTDHGASHRLRADLGDGRVSDDGAAVLFSGQQVAHQL